MQTQSAADDEHQADLITNHIMDGDFQTQEYRLSALFLQSNLHFRVPNRKSDKCTNRSPACDVPREQYAT